MGTRWKTFLGLLALSLLLACGGGGFAPGGVADDGPGPGASRANLRLEIANPRILAQGSFLKKIRVEIVDSLSLLQVVGATEVAPTPDQQTTSVTVFDVPPGKVVVRALFLGEQDTLLARDEIAVTLVAGEVTQVSLAFTPGVIQPPTPQPTQEFIYVASNGQISIFRLDLTNATLTPAGPPLPTPGGAGADEVEVTPDGRFAYINLRNTAAGLLHYGIDPSTGALSLLNTITPNGTDTSGPTLSPDGRFYFLPLFNEARIAVYSIDPDSGLPSLVNEFPLPNSTGQPQRAFVHPNGRFLYVADQNATLNAVFYAYSIDGSTGNLTLLGEFEYLNAPLPTRAFGFDVSPDGDVLYVSGADTRLGGFDIDITTGALTFKSGFPFTTADSFFLGELVVDEARRVLYVLGFSDDRVEAYSLNADDTLNSTPLDLVPTGANNNLVVEKNRSGDYLLLTNLDTNGFLTVYRITASGTLAPITGSPQFVGPSPFGIGSAAF